MADMLSSYQSSYGRWDAVLSELQALQDLSSEQLRDVGPKDVHHQQQLRDLDAAAVTTVAALAGFLLRVSEQGARRRCFSDRHAMICAHRERLQGNACRDCLGYCFQLCRHNRTRQQPGLSFASEITQTERSYFCRQRHPPQSHPCSCTRRLPQSSSSMLFRSMLAASSSCLSQAMYT